MQLRSDIERRATKGHWSEPLAGYIHDFTVPMRERAASRRVVGPYNMRPDTDHTCVTFYTDSTGQCIRHGSRIRLRIVDANDVLPFSGRRVTAYGFNDYDAIVPIIARLPRGRGFLAGWTMGENMISELERDIYEDEQSAAYAAHSVAEYAAERQRDFEESERDEDEDEDNQL
jgi:hypothetical protein